MTPSSIEILATTIFGLAVLHTFFVKQFEHAAHRYPAGSAQANLLHFLGEVEAVFGIWAGVLVVGWGLLEGFHDPVHYLENQNFTEPLFVFVIMSIAATRPVIRFASDMIRHISALVPLPGAISFFIVNLILGPLMGSFITEPAAMTVTALIMKDAYFDKGISNRFKYAILGALFVNISIGGTLTHFAAPPVLMVAAKWDWGIAHMMANFGWKSAVAVVVNAFALAFLFRNELMHLQKTFNRKEASVGLPTPWWLNVIHLIFLAIVVLTAHYPTMFMGAFLFFLGLTEVTNRHQDRLQLKESLLVGFFLAGLVALGEMQKWWLQPILSSLGEIPMFIGATGLTAITDNAALTFLGSQVEGLSDAVKYSLVAGAVAGGGLTVIANAPNPAGFGILKSSFGEDGISPLGLLLYAVPPTLIAMAALWWLPSLG